MLCVVVMEPFRDETCLSFHDRALCVSARARAGFPDSCRPTRSASRGPSHLGDSGCYQSPDQRDWYWFIEGKPNRASTRRCVCREIRRERSRRGLADRVETAVVLPSGVPYETFPIELESWHSIAKALGCTMRGCTNRRPQLLHVLVRASREPRKIGAHLIRRCARPGR